MLIYLHQILSLNKCCLVFFQVISSPMLNFQCEAFLLSSKCISLDIKYVIPACSALLIKVMHFGVAYKFKHISSFVIAYSNFFFFFSGMLHKRLHSTRTVSWHINPKYSQSRYLVHNDVFELLLTTLGNHA